MSVDAYVGEVMLFAGTQPPNGWLLCDGRQYPVQLYQVLFAVIGSVYGGDGKAEFAVPNLSGRVPVGLGVNAPFNVIGQKGGATSQTINIPVTDYVGAHTHPATFKPTPGSGGSPAKVEVNPVGGPTNVQSPYNAYLALAHTGVNTPVYPYNPTAQSQVFALAGVSGGGADTQGTVAIQPNTPGTKPTPTVQFDTIPPYQILNYYICCNGIYPSP